tara:strand:+ start:363 stop:575 length:213 start_codon:yes stop_codon:yes gene_type:complete
MKTYFIEQLNNKIQVLNSGPNKQIILSKQEAHGLHSEVYGLMTRITELEKLQEQKPLEEVISADVDGGSW